LFSAGSDLLFGRVHPRAELVLDDPDGFPNHLRVVAQECCDTEKLRILRSSWYDGAPNGIPAPEQIGMRERPRVKLRLGRLTGGGQKGVDGLIILDMINLATNRAIDTAVLVSGDEDLREAMLYAQGYGVSAILVGLPGTRRQGQSELLAREADHHVVLDGALVAAHLKHRPRVATASSKAPASVDGRSETSVVADQTDGAILRLAQEVAHDGRFSARDDFLDPGQPGRLTRQADKLLVAGCPS
jgi:hypothetical protein